MRSMKPFRRLSVQLFDLLHHAVSRSSEIERDSVRFAVDVHFPRIWLLVVVDVRNTRRGGSMSMGPLTRRIPTACRMRYFGEKEEEEHVFVVVDDDEGLSKDDRGRLLPEGGGGASSEPSPSSRNNSGGGTRGGDACAWKRIRD